MFCNRLQKSVALDTLLLRSNPLIVMKQIWILPICLAVGGCMSASKHYQQLGATQDRALTVGLVQKQIKPGISQDEVAAALGSPNIVTGDNQNRETWIYDKIASEASFSQDSGSVFASVTGTGDFAGTPFPVGDSGHVQGNFGGNYTKQAGAASMTQRTLTVIIKFTSAHAVESVSYNSTKF
jgi:hypothetical protein